MTLSYLPEDPHDEVEVPAAFTESVSELLKEQRCGDARLEYLVRVDPRRQDVLFDSLAVRGGNAELDRALGTLFFQHAFWAVDQREQINSQSRKDRLIVDLGQPPSALQPGSRFHSFSRAGTRLNGFFPAGRRTLSLGDGESGRLVNWSKVHAWRAGQRWVIAAMNLGRFPRGCAEFSLVDAGGQELARALGGNEERGGERLRMWLSPPVEAEARTLIKWQRLSPPKKVGDLIPG